MNLVSEKGRAGHVKDDSLVSMVAGNCDTDLEGDLSASAGAAICEGTCAKTLEVTVNAPRLLGLRSRRMQGSPVLEGAGALFAHPQVLVQYTRRRLHEL